MSQCGNNGNLLSPKKIFRQITSLNCKFISKYIRYFHEIFAKNVWERISAISTLCARKVWKNEKLSLTEKYFVKSTTYLVTSLVKTLFYEIFVRKVWKKKLHYFHNCVHILILRIFLEMFQMWFDEFFVFQFYNSVSCHSLREINFELSVDLTNFSKRQCNAFLTFLMCTMNYCACLHGTYFNFCAICDSSDAMRQKPIRYWTSVQLSSQ